MKRQGADSKCGHKSMSRILEKRDEDAARRGSRYTGQLVHDSIEVAIGEEWSEAHCQLRQSMTG